MTVRGSAPHRRSENNGGVKRWPAESSPRLSQGVLCVLEGNTSAPRFYESAGWSGDGTRKKICLGGRECGGALSQKFGGGAIVGSPPFVGVLSFHARATSGRNYPSDKESVEGGERVSLSRDISAAVSRCSSTRSARVLRRISRRAAKLCSTAATKRLSARAATSSR
jgi:hypothetical protein